MYVGLHEHGPLPIGRGGASVAKSPNQRQKLSATLMFKNGHNGRLLVDFLRPRLPRRKPRKRVSACRASSYFSGRCWTRTSDPLLVRQVL